MYVLDIGLPDMSGYELAGRLLAIHGENRPLLIALTGYSRPEDITITKASGFDYHLAKPSDIEELERIVSRHLAQPRIRSKPLPEYPYPRAVRRRDYLRTANKAVNLYQNERQANALSSLKPPENTALSLKERCDRPRARDIMCY